MSEPRGPEPCLVARDLHHAFGSGHLARPVLNGLSLEVEAGNTYLVMGASGTGKSTLLSLLGGLARPQAGRVEALGVDLGTLTPRQLEAFRLRHFGFVFQGFNLFAALSAIEQVALPLRFAGLAAGDARRRARDALDDVGLAAQLDLKPAQLSGGEKQRVAIARALAGRPAIVFADEPTSALDRANGERVMQVLQERASTHATAVVLVTHDPHLRAYADHVVELEDGGLRVLSIERDVGTQVA